MALIIKIKVVPASGRLKCIIDTADSLKCFLKQPPEKGKANTELIKYLSKKLKIPQEMISIVSGATDRKKQIKIETQISFDEVCQKLDIQKQESIIFNAT